MYLKIRGIVRCRVNVIGDMLRPGLPLQQDRAYRVKTAAQREWTADSKLRVPTLGQRMHAGDVEELTGVSYEINIADVRCV